MNNKSELFDKKGNNRYYNDTTLVEKVNRVEIINHNTDLLFLLKKLLTIKNIFRII